jgi:c-di-GMP-binding flagellar brake protein YcgR
LEVQLKDISLGGAFVVCPNPLPLSEKFRISIEPPEQALLELNAEVVWSNANVPEDKIINRGMGIRFINNTDEDRRRLNDVITSFFESE